MWVSPSRSPVRRARPSRQASSKGYENGELKIADGDRHASIPIDRVVTAKRKIGSYWEIGGAIGLTLDVIAGYAAIMAAAVYVGQHTSAPHISFGYGYYE
jgi:hypothetical protein